MIKGLHIMAEKNKIPQAVYLLKTNNLRSKPLAQLFANLQTSASGANGLCLQSSLQLQAVLQTVCKENKPGLQYFTKTPFANPFAENQT